MTYDFTIPTKWRHFDMDPESLVIAIAEYNNRIKSGKSIGTINPGEIQLTEASHIIQSLEYRDGKITGTLRLLDTPAGKILKDAICSERPQFGLSSYGILDEEKNTVKIQEIHQIHLKPR